MEIKPQQLLAICAALFGGIVLVNLAAQYRDSEKVKISLAKIPNFDTLASRLTKQEMMEQPEVDLSTFTIVPSDTNGEETTED
jgi:hypothetical protein